MRESLKKKGDEKDCNETECNGRIKWILKRECNRIESSGRESRGKKKRGRDSNGRERV